MEGQVKWGLLATGAIAHAYARGVNQSETGELHAVASRDLAKAEAFAQKFNAKKAFGSYEAMLADPEVEAVYVSTPHPMHAEWVLKCLEAGKHVLCEKPAGVNQWELQRMLALAAEKNLFFMEAFMYRCHPQTARLLELVREGAVGKIGAMQSTFSFKSNYDPEGRLWKNDLGGGGILDVGGYPVSLARLVAGAALGRDFADPVHTHGHAALDNPTRIDAWASAVMKFEGDLIATVHTGVGLGQDNATRIFGSEGSIVVHDPWAANRESPVQGRILLYRKGKEEVVEAKTGVTTYALEADMAGRAIHAGRVEAPSPAMSWADSLGNIRALDAWRACAGFVYDLERPERVLAESRANPVRVRPDAAIPRGKIAGLDKPVSKLVMGVMGVDHHSQLSVNAVFGAYFERGGNTFDTAKVYGENNSKYLGAWVNANNIREEVVLIAKGSIPPTCLPGAIRGDLDLQLGWLETPYADIYMMHRDNLDVPVGEFVDALNELTREGKIRAFGGSNWTLDRVAEANAYAASRGLQGFSVVSNNLALAEMVKPVWDDCLHNHSRADRDRLASMGVALLPWSSQARGFFLPNLAKPEVDKDRMNWDWGYRSLVESWYSEDNLKRQARAIELAAKCGAEPINIALAWVLQQKFPCFPLIGPRNIMELCSCLRALDITLTAAEMAWLNLEDK